MCSLTVPCSYVLSGNIVLQYCCVFTQCTSEFKWSTGGKSLVNNEALNEDGTHKTCEEVDGQCYHRLNLLTRGKSIITKLLQISGNAI